MSMSERPKRLGRKLLVATVGLATVSYVVACGGQVDEQKTDSGTSPDVTSGNLVPPDTGTPPPDVTSGNLVAPDTGTADTAEAAPPFDVAG
jgi:hypothetical protein